MEKLDKLLSQLKAIDEQIDALLTHDDLTDEQRAEHDRLVVERKKVAAAVGRERDRLAREQEREELQADADLVRTRQAASTRRQERTVEPGSNRLTDPDRPRVGPDRQEQRGTIIPATVRRWGTLQHFRGTRAGYTAEERAYRFGMFILSELCRQMPHRYQFQAATEWVSRNLAAVSSKDASGYHNLIPEEFGQDLIDLRERFGVVRRLFKMVPMSSDRRTDPRRQGGLTAFFVNEGSAGTESNKTWDNVGLTAKDLMCLSRYSRQVNADAVINVGDDLAGEIAYAFSEKEDQCGFNGDSTSTYGHIHGVRARLQDVDGAGTDSFGLVTGAGNAYSELLLTDFEAVAGKLPQFADTPNTCWVCHRTFYYAVMVRLEMAAGGVTAMEVSQGDRRPRPLFLGYPVEFSQVWPSAEANSQVCAALGDFALGARFGDRQQDEIEFSEHATIGAENVFERNQIAVRGIERFDINVHDVGNTTTAGPIVGLQTAAA